MSRYLATLPSNRKRLNFNRQTDPGQRFAQSLIHRLAVNNAASEAPPRNSGQRLASRDDAAISTNRNFKTLQSGTILSPTKYGNRKPSPHLRHNVAVVRVDKMAPAVQPAQIAVSSKSERHNVIDVVNRTVDVSSMKRPMPNAVHHETATSRARLNLMLAKKQEAQLELDKQEAKRQQKNRLMIPSDPVELNARVTVIRRIGDEVIKQIFKDGVLQSLPVASHTTAPLKTTLLGKKDAEFEATLPWQVKPAAALSPRLRETKDKKIKPKKSKKAKKRSRVKNESPLPDEVDDQYTLKKFFEVQVEMQSEKIDDYINTSVDEKATSGRHDPFTDARNDNADDGAVGTVYNVDNVAANNNTGRGGKSLEQIIQTYDEDCHRGIGVELYLAEECSRWLLAVGEDGEDGRETVRVEDTINDRD